jgi:hypothetical protein
MVVIPCVLLLLISLCVLLLLLISLWVRQQELDMVPDILECDALFLHDDGTAYQAPVVEQEIEQFLLQCGYAPWQVCCCWCCCVLECGYAPLYVTRLWS